ncbi:MAG TPA: GLUG motif-containing protein [Sedimentisphaerales bacterium]|nr:GLUG motif-containing protein [Sedimentisphaerales bacterium]
MHADRSIDRSPMTFRRAALAAVVLLFVSSSQAAEFFGGAGSAADPFQIATAQQLVSIADDSTLLTRYFVLVNDIDLDPNLPGGQVFTRAVIAFDEDPYRGPAVGYSGRFYGQGYRIRNLTIDAPGMQRVGLFGRIAPAGRVYDLVLEDVRITAPDHAGALAGINEGGLTNCSVTGRIRGPDQASWLGGLVGINLGTLLDCRAEVVVTAGDGAMMLGLLTGMHRGGMANCLASGELACGPGSFNLGGLAGSCVGGVVRDSGVSGRIAGGEGSWALGGLAGRADSESRVANCHANASVEVDARGHDLGGLIGTCFGIEIDHSYATGDVAGGLASYNLGGALGSCLGVSVRNSYAIGEVSGFRRLGGFVGYAQTGTSIVNCQASGRVLRGSEPWGRGGFAGHIDRSSGARLTGCFWDVDKSLASVSAGGMGLTDLQMRDPTVFQAAGWDFAGDGTDGAADLWLVPQGGEYPVLAAFSDQHPRHELKGSGLASDPYQIETPEDLGAIGRYNPSAWYRLVADIDLSGVTWSAAPIATFSGVFDGRGRRIRRLTLRSDGPERSGLFGRIEPGGWVFDLGLEDVEIIAADGSVGVGGLVGENAGNVFRCCVRGTIQDGDAGRNVGGLIGMNRLGFVKDCYSVVEIRATLGSRQIGGLIGYDYMGTVVNCYVAGRVSGGVNETLGGFVGRSSEHAVTTDGYFLAALAGGGPDRGSGIPVTAEQMTQRATFEDWDFRNAWNLCEGKGYPRLRWEGIDCDQ